MNMIKMFLKVIFKLLYLADFWVHEHTPSYVTSQGEKPVFE